MPRKSTKPKKKTLSRYLRENREDILDKAKGWDYWFYAHFPAHTGKIAMRVDILFMISLNNLEDPLKRTQWETAMNNLNVIYVYESIKDDIPSGIDKMQVIRDLFTFLQTHSRGSLFDTAHMGGHVLLS